MASEKTLSDEREAAFAALCSEDSIVVCEAASKLLSADQTTTTTARLRVLAAGRR